MTGKATSAQAQKQSIAPAARVMLQRQCACGNHTTAGGECTNCAKKKLQRKLSIGASNDPLELEADRVAEQVLAYQPTHSFSNVSAPKIQRRAENSSEQADEVPASVERVLASSGSALPSHIRNDMEQRFGYDFSRVRVHTGDDAKQSASDVNANAYAVQNNIVFGSGYFAPDTAQGKRLLAHELTHVIQQSAATKIHTNSTETKSNTTAPAVVRPAPINISRSSTPQLRRLTSKEAQKKLWGLVPDSMKPYARPLAVQARDAIETVIPPTMELPKAVEVAVEKAVAVAEVVNPKQTKPEVPATNKASAKPTAPTPKKPTSNDWLASKTKEKLRDKVMESLGTVKGVMLEATNIVDSVIWVSHAGNAIAEGGIEKISDYAGASPESKQGALTIYRTVFSQYATIQEQAKKNGWIDEVTGAVSVSGKFSAGFDSVADSVEKHAFSDLPKEQATIFTSYELGELEGAVGTQVALAYVGVEEAQLILKGLGVIGAVKSIVTSVQQNPNGWYKDPNFWVAILNAALTVVGLRQTKAAARLSKFLIAAGSLGNAIPVILRLAEHYSDPILDKDPVKKQKVLAQDYSALIKIVADAITSMIQHASASKKSGKTPAALIEEPGVSNNKALPALDLPTEKTSPAHVNEPTIPESAKPKTISPDPIDAALSKTESAPHPLQELLTPDAAPTKPVNAEPVKKPALVKTEEIAKPEIKTRTELDSKKPAELDSKKMAETDSKVEGSVTDKHNEDKTSALATTDSTTTSIAKEQAIAEKPVTLSNGENHEAVVTPKGIGLCSPGPCPLIHIEYKKELAQYPQLNEWHEKIQALRKQGKAEAAASEASQLIKTLDAARHNAEQKITSANKSKKPAIDIETSKITTPEEKQAAKDFKKITDRDIHNHIEKAFSDPVNPAVALETANVGDKTINSKSDRTRHLDVEGPKDANGKPINAGQVLTVQEAHLAQKVLGKTIASNEAGAAVNAAWNKARADVEKNYGPLTKDNYGELYNKTRDKFWDNVSSDSKAKGFFTDAGFTFNEARAPILAASSDKNLRPSQSRISLDHLEPKATGENWKYALDADKLMFVMQADNTKLQHIESTKPSLKRGVGPEE